MSPESDTPTDIGATDATTGLVRLAVGALLLLAVGLVIVGIVLWPGSSRPLYPVLASPTSVGPVLENETTLVGFAELNADPAAFRNQSIQVSGAYTPVELPICQPFAGPRIQWSLVAEELQLNAAGFERILRLAEPGISMTVTGIWRLYQGPLGCGKEPEDGAVWYLQVTQILEPNPITGSVPIILTFVPGPGDGDPGAILPTPAAETPDAQMTPTPLPTVLVTIQPTATLPIGATTGPEPSPTPTLPVTPLATPVTDTPDPLGTVTPASGTGTPDSTPDPAGTPTGSPGGTVTPPLPTGTTPPDGYPPASATPDDGYP